jgi:hypothetical protein
MPGERDLNALLATMQPLLAEGRFVFVTGVDESLAHPSVRPVMTFREREGATWIVTEAEAAALGLIGTALAHGVAAFARNESSAFANA